MKKVLIGCGVIALIFVIAVTSLVIFLSLKVKGLAEDYQAAAAQLEAVENDFPYTIPVTGTPMDAQRFDAWLQARDAVKNEIQSIPAITELFQAADENRTAQVGPGAAFGLIGDIPDAMSGVAERLREQEMSPSEYGWYAMETLEAIQDLAEQGNEEFADAWKNLDRMAAEIESSMQTQSGGAMGQAGAADVELNEQLALLGQRDAPVENEQLVQEHQEELTENSEWLIIEALFSSFLNSTSAPINP